VSPFLGTRGAGSNRAFGYAGAAAPAQVTGLTATNLGSGRAFNNGRIDLSWSTPASNGATITGYRIQRSTDGSTYSTLVANTGTTATTYSDTSLSSNQIYYYRIAAINAAGTGLNSTAANATATTVPQAPTIGTATDVGSGRAFNNGRGDVTFTAGATGGSAITGYTVTASSGGYTGTGSASPISVTGLQSGTSYTFTVTATNANGTSAASAASNSITATTIPQAPTIGTATVTNSTTVSLAFTAGATGGSAITSYTATSSPSIALTTSGTASPLTITGSYASNQGYTFTIVATNANGSSTASAASNSVTPLVPPTVTGGTLYSDATYYYRAFTSSGTLAVNGGSVTMDVLAIAGGGGGGGIMGIARGCGGGGAGGLLFHSSQSVSGNRTVTVGAGGAADISTVNGQWNQRATSGSPSQFGNLTASVGGGYGSVPTVSAAGRAAANGGSGGGSTRQFVTPGAGTSGQGTAGGANDASQNGGGGGGGSTGAGGEQNISNTTNGGNGGNGNNSYNGFGAATGNGQQSGNNWWYAGGGGGGGPIGANGGSGGLGGGAPGGWGQQNAVNTPNSNGVAFTGGGGGGAGAGGSNTSSGSAGGSGIVIVRYTRSQVGG
jgi:hypothetical protein